MIVCAVDPGGASTGIVVRHRDDLLGHVLVQREDGDDLALWVNACVDATAELWHRFLPDLLAVEGLNDPSPHMGVMSVRGLIDTAAVLGGLIGWAEGLAVELVPPGGHGRAAEGLGRRGLQAAYPAALIGDREQSGTGHLRHVRAAWDVAGAARHNILTTNA